MAAGIQGRSTLLGAAAALLTVLGALLSCAGVRTDSPSLEGTAAACQDRKDNDGDKLVDCDDADCWDTGACGDAAADDSGPPPRKAPVTPEVCGNGVDEDADGEVDEGCTCTLGAVQKCFGGDPAVAGVGECVYGTQTCISVGEFTRFGECTGAGVQAAESCDNKDNDCDGTVDDVVPAMATCGKGECFRSVQACVKGVPQTCVAGPIATEVCNGKDDDCNGVTDDVAKPTDTCGVGECRRTVPTCVAGVPQACTAGPRADEVCNGKDDDCDGTADNNLPATKSCGKGVCTRTVPTCVSGVPQACNPGPSEGNEVCDKRDNDCDGEVDEGLLGCVVNDVPLDLNGDCVFVTCPAATPYPVACNLTMTGGDTRGCVANTKEGATVFFKEGDKCDAGRITGTLTCSGLVGNGLNAANCAINKATRLYPTSSDQCPGE